MAEEALEAEPPSPDVGVEEVQTTSFSSWVWQAVPKRFTSPVKRFALVL